MPPISTTSKKDSHELTSKTTETHDIFMILMMMIRLGNRAEPGLSTEGTRRATRLVAKWRPSGQTMPKAHSKERCIYSCSGGLYTATDNPFILGSVLRTRNKSVRSPLSDFHLHSAAHPLKPLINHSRCQHPLKMWTGLCRNRVVYLCYTPII